MFIHAHAKSSGKIDLRYFFRTHSGRCKQRLDSRTDRTLCQLERTHIPLCKDDRFSRCGFSKRETTLPILL